MRVLAIVSALILILDQGSKYYVVHALNLIETGRIDVYPPYLNFIMSWLGSYRRESYLSFVLGPQVLKLILIVLCW